MTPSHAAMPVIVFARHDARRGIFWLRRAHAMFRAAPLRWVLLLAVYYVVLVALAELVPWSVGKIVASVLKPVFAVGFLAAAWTQERGSKPRLRDLFQGFRSNLWALVPLGIVLFAGMMLAAWATSLVDGGALIAWFSGGEEPSEELQRSGRLQLGFLLGAVCALPTILALWFAPGLVVFHDAGAAAALWTSLRAALANWRPAGVFGLVVLFYGVVLPAVGATLARIIGETAGTVLAVGVVFPYMLVFLATFQIADYVAYRDVFHPDEPAPLDAPADQAG
ncbi:MAG TPA: BPSS1780 family membrane protein [Casimicrobiaceae bacterium]|nr:BPSS1780 family membrane protein [Casimicrobiaceae bacterium]